MTAEPLRAGEGPVDPAAPAELAGLLADRTRAAFCLALIDGRAWTAGELARHAGVAASTAGEHLARLVDAGLLVAERQGRHHLGGRPGAVLCGELLDRRWVTRGRDRRSVLVTDDGRRELRDRLGVEVAAG